MSSDLLLISSNDVLIMWNFSVKQRLHLRVPFMYGVAWSIIDHSNMMSSILTPFPFNSQIYLDNPVFVFFVDRILIMSCGACNCDPSTYF